MFLRKQVADRCDVCVTLLHDRFFEIEQFVDALFDRGGVRILRRGQHRQISLDRSHRRLERCIGFGVVDPQLINLCSLLGSQSRFPMPRERFRAHGSAMRSVMSAVSVTSVVFRVMTAITAPRSMVFHVMFAMTAAGSMMFRMMFMMHAASAVVPFWLHAALMMAGARLGLTQRHVGGEYPSQSQ